LSVKFLTRDLERYVEVLLKPYRGPVVIDEDFWKRVPDYKIYDYAVLFSGGFDSTFSLIYLLNEMGVKPEDVILITVDLGQPYFWKEDLAYRKLKESGVIPENVERLVIHTDYMKHGFAELITPDKRHIPGRNLLLAYFGAFYADNVVIGSPFEEFNFPQYIDKDELFFNLTTLCFTAIFGRRKCVTSLIGNFKKPEMMRYLYEKFGVDYLEKFLKNTQSCYDERKWTCGECSSCVDKYVYVRCLFPDVRLDYEPSREALLKRKRRMEELYELTGDKLYEWRRSLIERVIGK